MDEHNHKNPMLDCDLLRLIVDSATDFAIFTMDPNGITTSWNTGAHKLLGYAEADIVGRPADIIFPREEPDAAAEERRIASALGRAEDERWQVRQDQTRFWASGLMMPLNDRAQGFVKILRDRTAQHRAEEQLKASERLFRVLLTSIPQLVFRATPAGHRTWVSPTWSIYCGISFADSLGTGWLDAVHAEDRAAVLAAWTHAAGQGELNCEYRLRSTATGEYRWHREQAVPLHVDGSGTSEWIGAASDVHDLRSLQRQQEILLDELEHRTRNLLAMVTSIAAQTIRSSATKESMEEDLRGRLRALSRILGALSASPDHELDLATLLHAELSPYLEGRAADISIAGPPVTLPLRAAQAIVLGVHELATNAAKYGVLAQPGARLNLQWRLESSGADRELKISWIESGVTMPSGSTRRKGYGSDLILEGLPYSSGARTRLEFGADGVRCDIAVALPAHA